MRSFIFFNDMSSKMSSIFNILCCNNFGKPKTGLTNYVTYFPTDLNIQEIYLICKKIKEIEKFGHIEINNKLFNYILIKVDNMI